MPIHEMVAIAAAGVAAECSTSVPSPSVPSPSVPSDVVGAHSTMPSSPDVTDSSEVAKLKANLAENERRIRLAEERREKKEAQMGLRIAEVERRLLEASPGWAMDLVEHRREPGKEVVPSSKRWNKQSGRWEQKGKLKGCQNEGPNEDSSSDSEMEIEREARFFPDWQVFLPLGMAPQ